MVIGIRAVVSGFSSLVQFIVDWGLGKIFDIQSATFEANFNDMKGRTVRLQADIVFMGMFSHIDFAFDFGNYLASVTNLALDILSGAGIDIPH
jgi:hypothetical protein